MPRNPIKNYKKERKIFQWISNLIFLQSELDSTKVKVQKNSQRHKNQGNKKCCRIGSLNQKHIKFYQKHNSLKLEEFTHSEGESIDATEDFNPSWPQLHHDPERCHWDRRGLQALPHTGNSVHCKRDWWNSGAKQEFSQHKARINPAMNKLEKLGKLGLSLYKRRIYPA